MKKWILTEEERETLVTMAAGQKPEKKAYYTEALAQIEKGELGLWNWSAALLGEVWMYYHKMFRVSNLLIIPFYGVLALLLVLWAQGSGVGIAALSKEGPVPGLEKLFMLLGLFWFSWIALIGAFGNRLLFWALRRKLKQGYLRLPSYKTTESWWLWVGDGSHLCAAFVLLLIEGAGRAFTPTGAELSVAIGSLVFAFVRVGGGVVIFWKAFVEPIRDSLRVRRLKKSLEKAQKEL